MKQDVRADPAVGVPVAADDGHDRSVAQLVRDLSEQLGRLVRDEMRLATLELQRKGKRLGTGAGLVGAAGVVALMGVATLVAAAVLALALVLPAWASALIVGGALLVAGGLAALVGRAQLRRGMPPVPEEAAASVAQDVREVRERARG